ncbi:MAG: hypothetical protein HKP54_10305 [Boseongicola sp.]|nr:hypothetical protein [Boseongicola sp.]
MTNLAFKPIVSRPICTVSGAFYSGIGEFPHRAIFIILDRDGARVSWYLFAMSERWGFDLSMEAVRLMRHRLGEWQEFAVEKLEGDDIEARLAALVAKVETPASVDIFLPRDQILFTDVKVSGETPTTEEIYSAMDGRTPYDLADLEIDWVATTPGNARVAAIATQTLEEAEAFVTKGGLEVRAFSALAAPEDFPRPPVFVEREPAPAETTDIADASAETTSADAPPETPVETPAFTTARTATAPLVLQEAQKAPAISDSASEPVVKVDDPTPVLQLPETDLPPLNPGAPLPRPTSEPRIVTNVGAGVAAARANSLTAPTPHAVRRRERAVPTPALAGIAALLSIVIAIIIWSILPSTPQSSLVAPETVEATSETENELAEATQTPIEEAAPEASPLPGDITAILDKPAAPALPEAAPTLAWATSPAPAFTPAAIPLENAGNFAADPRPAVEWLEPRPDTLDALEDYTPVSFVAAPFAIPESPDLAGLAAFEPAPSAVQSVSLSPVPDATVPANPALETDAPDALEPPAVAAVIAPEQRPAPEADATELAALDPAIVEAPQTNATPLPIIETDPAASEVVEPDTTEPDLTEPADVVTPTPAQAPALVPTALAAALPATAPRARPSAFAIEIERQRFGGRTRAELAEIRPGTRPQSAQIEALVARVGNPPSDLAVTTSVIPRTKPRDFDAIVAAGQLQLRQEREARRLAALTPDTSGAVQAALADEAQAEDATRPQNSPRLAIPSNASVARQATIEEAMRLNRINLVGVFGRPSDRRALVRLPSGRYVKVQVGDRVDGGTVAGISETALQYQKGGRTVQLTMPQG